MADIVVQRGDADRPAADIVEPLLATVPAAGARQDRNGQRGTGGCDHLDLCAPRRALGEAVSLTDPVAGRWAGKVVESSMPWKPTTRAM